MKFPLLLVPHTGVVIRVDVDFEPMKARIGENESLFRSANESIELEAESVSYRGEKVPFVCECPDLSCTDIVELTMVDYEDIRTGPTRFFVVPGHQAVAVQAGAAIVIEERDDVCISEKIGIAGEVAASRHGDKLLT